MDESAGVDFTSGSGRIKHESPSSMGIYKPIAFDSVKWNCRTERARRLCRNKQHLGECSSSTAMNDQEVCQIQRERVRAEQK